MEKNTTWWSKGHTQWYMRLKFDVLQSLARPEQFSLPLYFASGLVEVGWLEMCAVEPSHFSSGFCLAHSITNIFQVFDSFWFCRTELTLELGPGLASIKVIDGTEELRAQRRQNRPRWVILKRGKQRETAMVGVSESFWVPEFGAFLAFGGWFHWVLGCAKIFAFCLIVIWSHPYTVPPKNTTPGPLRCPRIWVSVPVSWIWFLGLRRLTSKNDHISQRLPGGLVCSRIPSHPVQNWLLWYLLRKWQYDYLCVSVLVW